MWQIKKDTVIKWYYYDGDEFNGDKVNTTFWEYCPGGSHTIFNNLEQQYYTAGENHVVKDGVLKLIAKRDTVTKRAIDWLNDNDSLKSNGRFYTLNKQNFYFTSGEIQTLKTYRYGYFECRFKVPKESGYWPAFWLHGGDPNEEIDMMECKSERSNQLHIDTHCPNHCDQVQLLLQKRSFGGWVKLKTDVNDGFNVAACEWDKEEVRFYLNGECVGISKAHLPLEKALTINLAVPSNNGPFHPGPDTKSLNEATLDIDYVRVWSKNENDIKTISKGVVPNDFIILGNRPLRTTRLSKTKSKLVYGNKKDHANEGIFVGYFNNKNNVQLIVQGSLNKIFPSYQIIDQGGKIIKEGELLTEKNDIDKLNFSPGEYKLRILYNSQIVEQSFITN